jgi:serine/threonine-protein kinase
VAVGDRVAPEIVGAYRIERELGHGGMGVVYAGVHQLLGRRAAVKVLLPDLSKKQELVQRFFNEAKAATAIKHPSIVEIYDFGYADDGNAFIVMELLEGETLAQRLKSGPLAIPDAVGLARQIANALAAAHKVGIVHRDLKPDNVFLIPDPEVAGGERVKLLDFGIAKLASETMGPARTVTGAILGTPHYMSPEQCEGSRVVDHRTDLYSLGCLLFQMITGRLPFESEGIGGLIGMHLYVAPPTLRSRKPAASVALENVVGKLLAKPVEERYQTASSVAAALHGPEVIDVGGDDAGAGVRPAGAGALAMAATIATPADGDLAVARTMTTEADRTLERAATELDPRSLAAIDDPPPTRVEPQPRRPRTMMWIAGAAVVCVAGAAIAYVVATRNDGGATAVVEPTTDAAVVVVVAPPDAVEQVQTQDVIDVAPDPQDALVELLVAMEKANKDKRYTAVAETHAKIVELTKTEPEHPIRQKADDVFEHARRFALVEIQETVERLARAGECMKLGEQVRRAQAVWGELAARRFARQADRCSKANRDSDPLGKPDDDSSSGVAIKIRRALEKGNEKVAIGSCLEARSHFSRDAELWQLCVHVACVSGNAGLAAGFYDLGDRPLPKALEQVCLSKDIVLEKKAPKPAESQSGGELAPPPANAAPPAPHRPVKPPGATPAKPPAAPKAKPPVTEKPKPPAGS